LRRSLPSTTGALRKPHRTRHEHRRLGHQTADHPYLFGAAPGHPRSFYTTRPRPERPAPPAAAHAATLPKVTASLPPSKHPHRVSTRRDPLRRSPCCSRTGRSTATLYPLCLGTVSDPTQRGRSVRLHRSGRGRLDRSNLAHLPYRRRFFRGFDFTAGGSHPGASKRSTFVGSSRPSSIHNRPTTQPKNRDLPSFRRRDFNAPGGSVGGTA